MSDSKEVFVKTENIKEKLEREKIRERLETQREKRRLLEKFRKAKTIDDDENKSDNEEDAAEWYQRTKHQHQKRISKQVTTDDNNDGEPSSSKRSKIIDKHHRYTSSDLKGLAIGHKADSIQEGKQIVLTLRDKDVLDEQEDVLENVNIVDDERAAKNVDNRKKRPEYRPYDDDEFDMQQEQFLASKKQSLLGKYDEEIDGPKNEMFRIGSTINTRNNQLGSFKMDADTSTTTTTTTGSNGKISLNWNDLKIANEYYTAEEMAVKFKKPSKKKAAKNLRQKQQPLTTNHHQMPDVEIEPPRSKRSRRTNVNDSINEKKKIALNIDSIADNNDDDLIGPDEDLSGIVIDDEAENELQSVLQKARKIKLKETISDPALAVVKLVEMVKREIKPEEDDNTNHSSMDNDYDEEEPDVSKGIAGALKLAMTKGYLDKETSKSFGATRATSIIQAQSYTIEEKFYDDDRLGRRDRYSGAMQEFREKDGYNPDFKLDYVDEKGRMMNQKEAFRYLSHKFHGKGPGKNKIDKRMKKMEQESKLRQMSSTDTPLNTVKLLQDKQKELQNHILFLLVVVNNNNNINHLHPHHHRHKYQK
ncbi:u4/u6.u5 tri-snrnp-associated protein 1-like [Dermatophagoides farinae]|uniref:U4/u6.u5 tri-snrnp-associated protein 1-like n=1 Tax=Dermatophagoides farinae TaxID=6954 RepID=A0A9D4SIW5_DERFA|nr:u4/u6.u5 tri-snrnp-associated protein 1-like [Dermatophagoides farinae]